MVSCVVDIGKGGEGGIEEVFKKEEGEVLREDSRGGREVEDSRGERER